MNELDAAAARLAKELAAWDERDGDREELPPEIHALMNPDGGVAGSTRRLRTLLPIVIERAREEGAAAATAAAVDGCREALAAMREWFAAPAENLGRHASDFERRMERAQEAVRGAIPSLRPRCAADTRRLLLDVEILGGWLGEFAYNARRRPGLPQEDWTLEPWTDYFRQVMILEHPMLGIRELDPAAIEAAAREEEKEIDADELRSRSFLDRGELEQQLLFAWDADAPERYLEMEELPEAEPDEEEEPEDEPWRESLEEPMTEVEEEDEENFQRSDALHEFLVRFGRARRGSNDPVDRYMTQLLLAAQVVLIKSGVHDEPAAHEAGRRVSAEFLARFAEAAAKWRPEFQAPPTL